MPVSLKACPYLTLCITFDFNKICFSSFCFDFFFSERAFAIATKVPLRQPDRRGLCFHPGISWFSRGPSELLKVLSEKTGKNV